MPWSTGSACPGPRVSVAAVATLDVDDLVARLRAAESNTHVREEVERAIRSFTLPTSAERPEVDVLHADDELTVVHVVIPPGLPPTLPHDHRMWAVVGIFDGQEDNEFFRRPAGVLEPSGGRSLRSGETVAMGADTIHAIQNPSSASALRALHVYGGNLVGQARSMWTDPGTEEPYEFERAWADTFT